MRLSTLTLLLGLAASGLAHAGTVNVSFADTPRFSDAGPTSWEERHTREQLAHFLQSLGPRYLPADQTLKVEITDIDLAGEVKPRPRAGRDLRILRGGADWPRITLRYSLEAGGKVLRSADEAVSDPDYTHHGGNVSSSDPLYYEKRMLEHWFRERFAHGG
jgi:hypothetical protein